MDTLIQDIFFLIMKKNNFRGEMIDISATKEALDTARPLLVLAGGIQPFMDHHRVMKPVIFVFKIKSNVFRILWRHTKHVSEKNMSNFRGDVTEVSAKTQTLLKVLVALQSVRISGFFFAEISVGSPWKSFIIIILKNLFWIEVSKKCFLVSPQTASACAYRCQGPGIQLPMLQHLP